MPYLRPTASGLPRGGILGMLALLALLLLVILAVPALAQGRRRANGPATDAFRPVNALVRFTERPVAAEAAANSGQ